jgi:alanine racemase
VRAQVRLSSTALLSNFQILAKQSQGQLLLPMVKANAYGHDAQWAAKILLGNSSVKKKIFGFGVATFDEAVALRSSLPRNSIRTPILVFSDCAPFSMSWVQLCKKLNFEPVLSELHSLLELQKYLIAQPAMKIPFHVEVNTGMNRLGIPVDSLKLIQLKPKSVFTHFAESENPQSSLTQKQVKEFEKVIRWKKQTAPQTLIHFANSGAIWNSTSYPFFKEMDLVRPGLSLYGIRPFSSAKNRGLKPVMTFYAPVIQKTFLEKGDRVGYGGLYQAQKKSGEWVATLGAGYADGVFRALANQEKILGKVSMDLITVRATVKTKLGDWVLLWGDGIDPYEVAARANTIPYEITTRIGERVKKVYE